MEDCEDHKVWFVAGRQGWYVYVTRVGAANNIFVFTTHDQNIDIKIYHMLLTILSPGLSDLVH